MKKIIVLSFVILSLRSVAQEPAKPKEFVGVLTLEDKYKDEKNWTEKEQGIVGEHFQRLVRMKKEGIVVLAGRTDLPTSDPNMMGLVIFYAKDDQEALSFMMNDPAVKNNIMKAKVFPYGIAINKCD